MFETDNRQMLLASLPDHHMIAAVTPGLQNPGVSVLGFFLSGCKTQALSLTNHETMFPLAWA